jgi:TolA-binding protein
VDDAPNQFSSLLVFGKRCQSDGEFEVAIQVFNRIIRDFPNARAVPSALSEIAACETQLLRWEEALKTYARLVNEYPETDFALSARYESGKILREGLRDPDTAENVFRELTHVREGPWAEADPQFEVAECAIWRGDIARARGIYRAIQERPFSGDTKERALYERARAVFYLGDFAQADSLFKDVAMHHPKGLHVNDALGFSILINTNTDGEEILAKYASAQHAVRTQAAEEAIETLEALGRDHPAALIRDEALLLLGRAYRAAGESLKALEALERAVEHAQVMDLAADARLLRAEILSKDRKDQAAALAEYEELLVTYPETLAADRARDLSADLMRTFP